MNKECKHSTSKQSEQDYYHRLIRQAFAAGLIGALFMGVSLINIIPPLITTTGQVCWFILGLSALVVIICTAGDIYRAAWNAFLIHVANMDTLIAIGTGAAWLFSMIVIIFPQLIPESAREVYFEAGLIIIAFVKLGAALEMRARGKTSQAIRRLIELSPKTARVVRDGNEIDLPIEDIKLDDVIRVRPGEKIAVDGVIIEGNSSIDQSMLTGESIPVENNKNDLVIGGQLNKTGSFLFRASRIEKNTVLAQISRWSIKHKAQNHLSLNSSIKSPLFLCHLF